MSGSLSSDQVKAYEENGFVVVPGVLRPDEVKRFLDCAREIAHGNHPPEARSRLVKDIRFAKGELPMPEDPEHALWKVLNPDRFDPQMADALRVPAVLDAVESLIGEDLLAFLLMFIYKPPGLAQAIHPFHQDAFYFPFGPHDQVLGVWMALDPVDADNGSLTVVPGSHKEEVVQHGALDGVNAGAFAANGAESQDSVEREGVTLELDPGDCVLFHSRLLHRTGGNHTDRHRRVITVHIASAQCKPRGQATGNEYGFALVRGRTHEGALQPARDLSVSLHGRRTDSSPSGQASGSDG